MSGFACCDCCEEDLFHRLSLRGGHAEACEVHQARAIEKKEDSK